MEGSGAEAVWVWVGVVVEGVERGRNWVAREGMLSVAIWSDV